MIIVVVLTARKRAIEDVRAFETRVAVIMKG